MTEEIEMEENTWPFPWLTAPAKKPSPQPSVGFGFACGTGRPCETFYTFENEGEERKLLPAPRVQRQLL